MDWTVVFKAQGEALVRLAASAPGALARLGGGLRRLAPAYWQETALIGFVLSIGV